MKSHRLLPNHVQCWENCELLNVIMEAAYGLQWAFKTALLTFFLDAVSHELHLYCQAQLFIFFILSNILSENKDVSVKGSVDPKLYY